MRKRLLWERTYTGRNEEEVSLRKKAN